MPRRKLVIDDSEHVAYVNPSNHNACSFLCEHNLGGTCCMLFFVNLGPIEDACGEPLRASECLAADSGELDWSQPKM
jgi:hypothetical protein